MNRLRRFLAHNEGVSATEFAIAAPLLLLLLAGIVTGWTYEKQSMELRSAVKSGANYVLQVVLTVEKSSGAEPRCRVYFRIRASHSGPGTAPG